MKKLIIGLAFLLLFVSITPRATLAQNRQEIKEQKVALDQKRQEKITIFFERMTNKYETAILRLEKLITRIETRIEEEDIETPNELTEAKKRLIMTKSKIETIKIDFETMLISNKPKEVFKNVGKELRLIKSELVAIHKLLVSTIGDIKGLGKRK
ncbi:MAG: hypothetical protein AAB535_01605 [Patescibacteria group bacterium]